MKNFFVIICILLLALISTESFCQTPPGYTKISARYDWVATKSDSGLHIPGYSTVPNRRTGVWTGSANIGVDTVNHKFYFLSGGTWREAGGASGDLLVVTGLGNDADSIDYRDTRLFDQPTFINASGASFVNPGTGSTVYDSTTIGRIMALYGFTMTNYGYSGSGVLVQNKLLNAGINPGNRGMFIGLSTMENDLRLSNTNSRFTQNKEINGLKSMYINFHLASFTPAYGATKSGTWATFDTRTYGGKSSNGYFTQTSGDSITYTFTGQKNVVVTLLGCDGTNVAGAAFKDTLRVVGGATITTGSRTTNLQTDGVSDGITGANNRTPMGFIYSGLDPTKTYKLKLVSNTSTNFLYVDYFGHLVDTPYAKPMVLFEAVHFTSGAYSTYGGSDAIMDTANVRMDSVAAALNTLGRKIYVVPSNTYYNPNTDASGDGLHPSDQGYRKLFNGYVATFPSLGVPANGTIFNSHGQTYIVVNDKAVVMGVSPGMGITQNIGVFSNDLSTGKYGGQALTFGQNTTDTGAIYSNPYHNGIIYLGLNNAFNESTNRFGIGTRTPFTTVDITNTGANSSEILTIRGITSQSGNHIVLKDVSGNEQASIGPGAFFKGLPSSTSGSGLIVGLDPGVGEAEINALNTGVGYLKLNIRAKGIKFTDGSGVGDYLTANASGVWNYPLLTASKPLSLDASKNLVSINLDSSVITGLHTENYYNTKYGSGGGGSGVTTPAAIGSSPNANAITIAGSTINLEPASASFGGVVTTGTQAFSGAKSWNGQAAFGAGLSVTGPNATYAGITRTYDAGGLVATDYVYDGSFHAYKLVTHQLDFISDGSVQGLSQDASGRIGIGIGAGSASEKLDVSGNVKFSGAFMPGGSAGTSSYLLKSNGAGSPPTWVDPAAYQQIVVAYQDFSNTVCSGTTETNLENFSSPGATGSNTNLSADGQQIYGNVSGTFTDLTATARLKLKVTNNSVTTTIFDSGTLTVSAIGGWDIDYKIIRASSSSVKCMVKASTPGASTATYSVFTTITGMDLTLSSTITCTGQAGGASGGTGDITTEMGKAYWSINR